MVTLSFRRADDAERVVEAMVTWLSNPAERPAWIQAEAVSQ